MKQQALWIVWPSFLMAGVLEMLVFSVADPRELHGFGGALAEMSATGLYTLAFFAFWFIVALASSLTLLLATPEPAATNPGRRWP
jgi:uncharacterized membrane protein YcfT